MKSETVGQWTHVVIEQYDSATRPTRIAKFCLEYEAQMFCDLMNEKHPNRQFPYVVRKLVRR